MIHPDSIEASGARPLPNLRDLERHTFLDVDDIETASGDIVTVIEEPEVMGFTASVIELRERFMQPAEDDTVIDLTLDEHARELVPVASTGDPIDNPFPRPRPIKGTPAEGLPGNVIPVNFTPETYRKGYPLQSPKRLDIDAADQALRDFLDEHTPRPTEADRFDEEIRALFADTEPILDPGDFAITEPLSPESDTEPLGTFELPPKKRGFMRRVIDKIPRLAHTPEAKQRRTRRIGIGVAVASVALAVATVGIGGKVLGSQQDVEATPMTPNAPTTTVYEAPTTTPTTVDSHKDDFVMPVLTVEQDKAFSAMVSWSNTHPNASQDDFKKTVEFAWQLEQLGITTS